MGCSKSYVANVSALPKACSEFSNAKCVVVDSRCMDLSYLGADVIGKPTIDVIIGALIEKLKEKDKEIKELKIIINENSNG